MFFNKKSILFIVPDYHNCFLIRDELRKRGWRAEIYAPSTYPEQMLYQNDVLRRFSVDFVKSPVLVSFIYRILDLYYLIYGLSRYKYFVFHHSMDALPLKGPRFLNSILRSIFGDSFRLSLSIGRLFGKKYLYIPSGCRDHELKSVFSTFGSFCDRCIMGDEVCNDELNMQRFRLHRRYSDFINGSQCYESTQLKETHAKYKCLDLDLWHPDIDVPEEHRLPPTENIRIMHSFYRVDDRADKNTNYKGSKEVEEAVERLKDEGYPVDFMFIKDVHTSVMRFYQVQADIYVEQLYNGRWGSTGCEIMALGKPVVCYFNPSWKKFFLETFPEEKDFIPIVEADGGNIYEVLKRLVSDTEYRKEMGRKSRIFAERFYDVKKNTDLLEDILLGL